MTKPLSSDAAKQPGSEFAELNAFYEMADRVVASLKHLQSLSSTKEVSETVRCAELQMGEFLQNTTFVPYQHVTKSSSFSAKANAVIDALERLRRKAELLDDPDLHLNPHVTPAIKGKIDAAVQSVKDAIKLNQMMNKSTL